MSEKKIAVIGGGAAGMAAAIRAARRGACVTLYERNDKLGRKLGITGKGRCNLTNACSPAEFLASITKNSKFMYSAAYSHPPSEIMDFFSSLGVKLKVERGGRVFPCSDKAAEIVNALRFSMKDIGVNTVYPRRVKKIEYCGDGAEKEGKCGAEKFVLHFCGKETPVYYDSVIVCTGGLSYPKTGSDGDGYAFAEALGISVTERMPSLIPIDTEENTEDLAGLTLKNVTLSVWNKKSGKKGKKAVFSEMGEALFTHSGISGPLALSASAHMRDGDIANYAITIDLKPAVSEEELDARLTGLFREEAAKDFINATARLLPIKLIKAAAEAAGVPERIKAGEISREARRKYVQILKAFPLTPRAFRPIDEAIITSGGVDVRELNPKTMESKRISGLYFAGEVIDVDAYTGGYNLQIAFSTAFSAADAAAE